MHDPRTAARAARQAERIAEELGIVFAGRNAEREERQREEAQRYLERIMRQGREERDAARAQAVAERRRRPNKG